MAKLISESTVLCMFRFPSTALHHATPTETRDAAPKGTEGQGAAATRMMRELGRGGTGSIKTEACSMGPAHRRR